MKREASNIFVVLALPSQFFTSAQHVVVNSKVDLASLAGTASHVVQAAEAAGLMLHLHVFQQILTNHGCAGRSTISLAK